MSDELLPYYDRELSYIRRLLQGRIDIVDAEMRRRAPGGEDISIVDQLAQILADDTRSTRGVGRHLNVEPSRVDEHRRDVEQIVADAVLSDVGARTDEELRPTFELLRSGKMPEAETMLGKLLNNMLTTEIEREEGQVRKQRIDGSSLPNFEAVRRYLGPAGRVLRSERDGWFITAAVLNKEAP